MPRRKPTPPAEAATATAPAPIVDPNAVYTAAQLRQLLGLKASSIRTAWRKQGLVVARRCGRIFVRGQWVLDWLEGGRVAPR